MKSTVYIETSVISYLSARASRDLIIAAHQQITIEWWETSLKKFEAYISPIVLDEISKGDFQASETRMNNVSRFPVLEVVSEVQILADLYYSKLSIPDKARADTYHLALAAWHGIDYLVSWNCTHIVSGKIRAILEEINSSERIRTPIICTPEELME